MSRRPTWSVPAVVSACLLSCSGESPPTAPLDRTWLGVGAGGAGRVTVLTQNLYPGANLDLVIEALVSPDPADDAPAFVFALATLLETDFPARAAAVAEQLRRERPHAVGLQEVFEYDLDVNLGTPIQLHLPFLPVLMGALASRGLNYVVAAQNTNFTLTPFPGITLSDSDVLLVDADRVTVESAGGQTFSDNLPPLGPLLIERGWVRATVRIEGRRYVLASAHPESGFSAGLPLLRAAQLAELLASLPAGDPVILMGDLNDYFGSPMYQLIVDAGFTDVWPALRPGVDGSTCCHEDDLSENVPRFDERIDYVFARGLGDLRGRIYLVGEVPADRIPGPAHPLWPSDHAGLVATFLFPPGRLAGR